jgi:hypoxia induced protein
MFVAGDPTKMHSLSNLIVATGVGAVTIVLLLGLINMLRGGSPNRSQKLMRRRVGLQFAVIVIIMGILWLRG